MKKIFMIIGVLVVAGGVIAGALYLAFPVPMTTYGGMGLNFLKSLSAPAGTLTLESNPAYKAPVAAVPSVPTADAMVRSSGSSDPRRTSTRSQEP